MSRADHCCDYYCSHPTRTAWACRRIEDALIVLGCALIVWAVAR